MALAMLVVAMLVLLLSLGMMAAYPQRWRAIERDAALREVERRLVGFGPRSQADLLAAERMVGFEVGGVGDSEKRSEAIVDALLVFTGSSDRVVLEEELRSIQKTLEVRALTRQIASVSRVPSIKIASYRWRAESLFSRILFAWAGFRWFLPRARPYLLKQLQKRSGTLFVIGGLAGAVLGIIAGSFVPQAGLGLAANIAYLISIFGMVLAAGELYKKFLVLRFGPSDRWSWRGIVKGAVFVFVSIAIFSAVWFSLYLDWLPWTIPTIYLDRLSRGAKQWIGGILMTPIFGYMLLRAARLVRNRELIFGDRLTALLTVLLLGGAAVALVLFLLDAPTPWLQPVLLLCGLTFVGGTMVVFVAGCMEWIKKYQTLARFDRAVKNKGFRWWVLIAWLASTLVLTFVEKPLTRLYVRAENSTLITFVLVGYNLFALLWLLALIVGAVVVWLYIRRVSKAYEALLFELAPAHPGIVDLDTAQSDT